MRIVCAFSDLSPETEVALPRYAQYVDVSYSDEAYFDLLAGLWADGKDVAIVEQDVVVNAGTIQSFRTCPHDCCCAAYQYLGSDAYAGLGCIRFRSALMRRFPDLFDLVAKHDYPGHTPRHWCTCDAAIQRELEKRGESRCLNHARVRHLSPTVSHGCC